MALYIILGVLVLAVLLVSGFLVKASIYPKTKEYNFTYNHEIEKGFFTREYYEGLEKEEMKIKSSYGYDINAIYFPCKGSDVTAIIAHGYSYTLFGSVKYVRMFHNLGVNALVYDQRYHGLSGGRNSTFGYREKDDLKTVFDYMEDRFGSEMAIGTHGESLGGATVLLHGAEDDRVAFIVADCSFSDMRAELKHRLKEDYKLPAFPFLPVSSLMTKLVGGGFYRQVSPMSTAHNIKCPTMIIHGMEDDYTPYEQGGQLYDKLKCSKYFYGVEDAAHAKSIVVNEEKYTEEVRKFLTSNNIL